MKATSQKVVVTAETVTVSMSGQEFKILQSIAKKASQDTWTWSSTAAKFARDFSDLVPNDTETKEELF